jgi:hypothetical protein
MRIAGMNKYQVVKRYPVLEKYQEDASFITTAYHVIIEKITEGLNLKECQNLAKERLDFSLFTALTAIDDFKKGAMVATKHLDNAICLVACVLEDLKRHFYTPPVYYRVSKTGMFLGKTSKARKAELSKIIWLMTSIYVVPETWSFLINEIIDDRIVYWHLQYIERGIKKKLRVNSWDYLLYKKQGNKVKISPTNKQNEIIDIVNSHFGYFKITSVFATERIGDRLIIYPTSNGKETVEMNLFKFEELQHSLTH